MSNKIESGLLQCRDCKREIRYCCEATVRENRLRFVRKREYIANADRYYANRTVSGFTVEQQREQLLKQKYVCAVCGRPTKLVIDRELTDNRLRFVCRPCLTVVKKVREYQGPIFY